MGARRLAGLTAAALLFLLPGAALAMPAAPDGGFGSGGLVLTDFPGRDSQAAGMILDSAARPVVAARTAANEVGLLRLSPDGAPELATPTALAGPGELTDVVEQLGGGYATGGWVEPPPGERQFALARYGPAGDGLGVVTHSPGPGDDEIDALALQPDGRIVAAGSSGAAIGMARYGAGGAAEPGFPGVHDLIGVAAERASGVVVEPSGRILLAGTGVIAGERRFLLTALTPAGAIDGGFGGGGLVTLDVGDGDAAVSSLVRQPDGKLLVAGTTHAGGGGGGVVARFLPDGTPDLRFSTDGIARLGVAGAIVEDVALQADGKVVAVGAAGGDSLLARFRPGGARDPGFGSDGVVVRALGAPGPDGLTGVGVGAGGRIVAGGIAGGAGPSIAVTRLVGGDSSDPALAMTAGSVGELVSFTLTATNPGADPATGVAVTVAPPGAVRAAALTMAGGACSGTTCSVGTLAPGAIRRMTLLARARRRGPLTASARIAGATFDSNTGNNTASATGTAGANRARRDRIRPSVALRLKAKRIGQLRKRVRLVVRTSEAARVRVRMRAKARGKTRKLARTRTVKLRRSGAKTVRLKLSKAGRRAVKRKRIRRMKVTVKARAFDTAGNARSKTLRRTLRR